MRISKPQLLAGLTSGLLASLLIIGLLILSENGNSNATTMDELGGFTRLLVIGAVMGLAYSMLYLPRAKDYPVDMMNGIVLGIITWIIFTINVFPITQGAAPMWDIQFSRAIFPQLIAFLFQGATIGLVYGLLFSRLKIHNGEDIQSTKGKPVNIVIVGGGYAGVSVAEVLDKEYLLDSNVIIWLVNSTNYLVHTPMLSEVSASAVNAQNISPPLRSFFKNVRVVQGKIDQVDWQEGKVFLEPSAYTRHEDISFDQLVITAGGVPNYFGNQAVASNTMSFKSLEDSIRLRNRVIDLFERADFETDPKIKQQMLTFVVVGGGFAGVELIGGLNDFGRGMLPNYPNLNQEDLRFILIHTRDVILPELSEPLGLFAQEKMSERGIEFLLNTRVSDARKGVVIMGEHEIAASTVIWTAGNRPNPVVGKLGVALNKRGQIPVAATMQSPERPNLWAAGDCAQIPIPDKEGAYYPPTAQHALREGKMLAANIISTLKKKPLKIFNYKSQGSLAVLGHQLAVAEVFGLRFSGFLAWLMWRGIYLSKLPSFEKQLRVLFDWILDIFFPPDIVQTTNFYDHEVEEKQV